MISTYNGYRFQQGEIIQVELSFTSSAKNRYQLKVAEYDRSGRLEIESYHLDPSGGATDALKDRDPGGIGGACAGCPSLGRKGYS
jgi:hypothetical protein